MKERTPMQNISSDSKNKWASESAIKCQEVHIINLEKRQYVNYLSILNLSATEADGSEQFYYPDTNSQLQQISSIQYFAMLPPFSIWILIWHTAHKDLTIFATSY